MELTASTLETFVANDQHPRTADCFTLGAIVRRDHGRHASAVAIQMPPMPPKTQESILSPADPAHTRCYSRSQPRLTYPSHRCRSARHTFPASVRHFSTCGGKPPSSHAHTECLCNSCLRHDALPLKPNDVLLSASCVPSKTWGKRQCKCLGYAFPHVTCALRHPNVFLLFLPKKA